MAILFSVFAKVKNRKMGVSRVESCPAKAKKSPKALKFFLTVTMVVKMELKMHGIRI